MATDEWLPIFWKAIHIFAVTFNPRDQITLKSYHCFYQCLSEIVPSERLRILIDTFISSTKYVKDLLTTESSVQQYCSKENLSFLSCFQTPEKLFVWTYLLRQYYNMKSGLPVDDFETLRLQYTKDKIYKDDWGSAIWKIMHYSAYYSNPTKRFVEAFKAFISCLRYCIPCPECRKHLTENLGRVAFPNNPTHIFAFTVDLHNLVNSQVGHPVLSLREAEELYKQ